MRIEQPKELNIVSRVEFNFDAIIQRVRHMSDYITSYKGMSPGVRAELLNYVERVLLRMEDEPSVFEEHSYFSYYIGTICAICALRAKAYELYEDAHTKFYGTGFNNLSLREQNYICADHPVCLYILIKLRFYHF